MRGDILLILNNCFFAIILVLNKEFFLIPSVYLLLWFYINLILMLSNKDSKTAYNFSRKGTLNFFSYLKEYQDVILIIVPVLYNLIYENLYIDFPYFFEKGGLLYFMSVTSIEILVLKTVSLTKISIKKEEIFRLIGFLVTITLYSLLSTQIIIKLLLATLLSLVFFFFDLKILSFFFYGEGKIDFAIKFIFAISVLFKKKIVYSLLFTFIVITIPLWVTFYFGVPLLGFLFVLIYSIIVLVCKKIYESLFNDPLILRNYVLKKHLEGEQGNFYKKIIFLIAKESDLNLFKPSMLKYVVSCYSYSIGIINLNKQTEKNIGNGHVLMDSAEQERLKIFNLELNWDADLNLIENESLEKEFKSTNKSLLINNITMNVALLAPTILYNSL